MADKRKPKPAPGPDKRPDLYDHYDLPDRPEPQLTLEQETRIIQEFDPPPPA